MTCQHRYSCCVFLWDPTSHLSLQLDYSSTRCNVIGIKLIVIASKLINSISACKMCCGSTYRILETARRLTCYYNLLSHIFRLKKAVTKRKFFVANATSGTLHEELRTFYSIINIHINNVKHNTVLIISHILGYQFRST